MVWTRRVGVFSRTFREGWKDGAGMSAWSVCPICVSTGESSGPSATGPNNSVWCKDLPLKIIDLNPITDPYRLEGEMNIEESVSKGEGFMTRD